MNGLPHVVAAGNLVGGFAFFGPFDSYQDANEWATRWRVTGRDDWQIIELELPEDDK